MQQNRFKDIVDADRKYIDILEAADKLGTLPKFNKVRRNFTLDEEAFNSFQDKCSSQGLPMSRVIEKLIKEYSKK